MLLILIDSTCSDQGRGETALLRYVVCYLRPWQVQCEEIVLFDSRFSREDISFAFDVTYYNFYYFAVISVHLALYTLDCFLS